MRTLLATLAPGPPGAWLLSALSAAVIVVPTFPRVLACYRFAHTIHGLTRFTWRASAEARLRTTPGANLARAGGRGLAPAPW